LGKSTSSPAVAAGGAPVVFTPNPWENPARVERKQKQLKRNIPAFPGWKVSLISNKTDRLAVVRNLAADFLIGFNSFTYIYN
jgi:hypothetical protein